MTGRWGGKGLLLVLLVGTSACSSGPTVTLRERVFTIEIADSDAERERGLMFRDHMAADAGMLFLFEDEQPRSFWMKNCRIGLDILYFDAAWKLVGQSLSVPPCSMGDRCPSYPSGAPARYVLELNAGTAQAMGVQLGDSLTVSGLAAPN